MHHQITQLWKTETGLLVPKKKGLCLGQRFIHQRRDEFLSVRCWLFCKWTPRRISAHHRGDWIWCCVRASVSVCALALWSIKLIGSLACLPAACEFIRPDAAIFMSAALPTLPAYSKQKYLQCKSESCYIMYMLLVLGKSGSVCIVLVPAAAHALTPGPHCRDIKLNLQRSLFAPGASSLSHARSRLIHTHILAERQGKERVKPLLSREKQPMWRPECLICVDLIMLRRRRLGLRRLWIVRCKISPARKLCGDDEKVGPLCDVTLGRVYFYFATILHNSILMRWAHFIPEFVQSDIKCEFFKAEALFAIFAGKFAWETNFFASFIFFIKIQQRALA